VTANIHFKFSHRICATNMPSGCLPAFRALRGPLNAPAELSAACINPNDPLIDPVRNRCPDWIQNHGPKRRFPFSRRAARRWPPGSPQAPTFGTPAPSTTGGLDVSPIYNRETSGMGAAPRTCGDYAINRSQAPFPAFSDEEREPGTKLADVFDIESITHPTMLANYNLRGQWHRLSPVPIFLCPRGRE
jgi:hypothetical protein